MEPTSRKWWREIILTSSPRRRRQLIGLTLALVMVIGAADFRLGFELSFQVFYIFPVCLAVAAVGWRFGVITAVASVASALVGDFLAGARYPDHWVPLGNSVFAIGTYLAVIGLFTSVLALQREMEERVRQRTAALQGMIAERDRLEKAILDISERERRRIGHDLHDDLGQHLTGTAFACEVLAEKLQAKHLSSEEGELRRILNLIEEAVEKTRWLARGLLLAEIQPDALPAALQEFATSVSGEIRVGCDFRHEGDRRLADSASATHLFHIVQEAVHNAIRHGKAKRIEIKFAVSAEETLLAIEDDGAGLPPSGARGNGLGLRIMAHRAEIIGWQFSADPRPGGGTVVACRRRSLPYHE